MEGEEVKKQELPNIYDSEYGLYLADEKQNRSDVVHYSSHAAYTFAVGDLVRLVRYIQSVSEKTAIRNIKKKANEC